MRARPPAGAGATRGRRGSRPGGRLLLGGPQDEEPRPAAGQAARRFGEALGRPVLGRRAAPGVNGEKAVVQIASPRLGPRAVRPRRRRAGEEGRPRRRRASGARAPRQPEGGVRPALRGRGIVGEETRRPGAQGPITGSLRVNATTTSAASRAAPSGPAGPLAGQDRRGLGAVPGEDLLDLAGARAEQGPGGRRGREEAHAVSRRARARPRRAAAGAGPRARRRGRAGRPGRAPTGRPRGRWRRCRGGRSPGGPRCAGRPAAGGSGIS